MKFLFVTVFTFLISTITAAQWERTNGPEGISINSLASAGNVLYAATSTDGVYASTDEGSTWYALNNGIETEEITTITSINDTLLIGTYDYGVYHSTDSGQTWLPSSNYSGVNVATIVVKDQYVFAGTSQGLFRSSDGGITWEDISFLPFYESVTAMCATGDKLFATDFTDTFVSINNGETWNTIGSIGLSIFSLYARGDTVFAGGQNEIYRSTDDGNTFIQIEIPFNFSIVNIYTMTFLGQTLFMGTSYDGVYKSTNNGATWLPANTGMGPKSINTLVVTQSSILVAGASYTGIYISTDNGLNWNKSVTGFPAGSEIWSLFNSDRGLLAGTSDGLYKTTDNGTSWEKLTGENDTINYGEVRGIATRGLEIYAAITYQFNGIVYKSTDFGETWTRSGNGFATDITFMSGIAVSGNNIVAGSDQGLYYSTDDGNSWILSNQTEGFFEEIAVTPDYLYAQSDYDGVYRSSDDGISWVPSLISPSISLTSITAQGNHAYAGDFDEGFFFTDDNGSNWYFSSFSGISFYAMKFIPAITGMALAGTNDGSSYIYASFNNSHNFSPYSEGLGVHSVTEAFSSNDTYTFAGTDYTGVWRRFLPGITPVELTSFTVNVDKNNVELNWQTASEKNNSGFEVQRSDVKGQAEWDEIGFVEGHGTTTESNSYLFIDKNLLTGQYQYKLKQIDYDGSFKYSNVVEVNVLIPTEFSLEQNFPNPFNPTTTIKYSIPESGNVKMTVFNSLGEKIAVLVNEYKEAGTYKINFNAHSFTSGIYFYRLEAGSYKSVKKMILLK